MPVGHQMSPRARSALEATLDLLSGKYPSTEFAELRPRLVWDRETGTLQARPGALRLATTSGGTIPDRGLFGVFMVGEKASRVTQVVDWLGSDFDGAVMDDPELTIPHPRAHERAFVLFPWALLEPQAELAGSRIAELAAQASDARGVRAQTFRLEDAPGEDETADD